MRLLIIRHADPDYANNTITAAGHLEARALADRLAGERISRIFSSPLGRALDTMRYTADRLRLNHEVLHGIAELDLAIERAPWGRMAAWDCPGELIRGDECGGSFADAYLARNYPEIVRTEFARVQRESDALIASLGYQRVDGRYRVVRANRDRIAVFCHGGFGLTWLAYLLDIPLPLFWSGFWMPPSSVTTILFDERSPHWAVPRCIGFGDVSHLHMAGLPVQPSGIKANFE